MAYHFGPIAWGCWTFIKWFCKMTTIIISTSVPGRIQFAKKDPKWRKSLIKSQDHNNKIPERKLTLLVGVHQGRASRSSLKVKCFMLSSLDSSTNFVPWLTLSRIDCNQGKKNNNIQTSIGYRNYQASINPYIMELIYWQHNQPLVLHISRLQDICLKWLEPEEKWIHLLIHKNMHPYF